MPTLLSTARRIAQVEALLGPEPPAIADGSPWDWFAAGCPCGRPAGECTLHPRARAAQRPPAGNWRTRLLLGGRAAATRDGAALEAVAATEALTRGRAPSGPIGTTGTTGSDRSLKLTVRCREAPIRGRGEASRVGLRARAGIDMGRPGPPDRPGCLAAVPIPLPGMEASSSPRSTPVTRAWPTATSSRKPTCALSLTNPRGPATVNSC